MLVTDRRRTRGRDLISLVAEAVEGGVGMVQLREKDLPDDRVRELLHQLRGAVPPEVVLLVNSSSRVARTQRVGLHLPADRPFPLGAADGTRDDYPYLGRSVHDLREARDAIAEDPSYLILGTVFPTASKPGHPGSGPELVRKVSQLVAPVPVYAIGGVSVSAIPPLIRAGAYGIAVCGALLQANDPRRVAEAMTLALGVACRAARNEMR
jgi:thiamine-phosphate pyrophosphorylase